MLTLADQGQLVVCMINHLPNPADMAAGGEYGCCPGCCASCEVLEKLLKRGSLDTVVRQAPGHFWGPQWMWWRNDGVDKSWLADCWAPVNRPPCEHSE